MLRVKAGDVDRMGLLFERHHRPLFGFLYHMLGRSLSLLVLLLCSAGASRAQRKEATGKISKEFTLTADAGKSTFALNLRVGTVNHGAVEGQDVTGPLHVNNVNGSISLTSVKGITRAHTVNDNVDATCAANPPKASSYHTINGKIRVHYPAGLGADLHFKSMHGEFYTDFPNAEILSGQVTKNQEGKGGGIVYRLTKDTAVRIGKGGPDFRFETLNGKVDLTFPANMKASLKMKSERGEIFSGFDVAVDKAPAKVTKSSQNGLTKISTDDWTYGKVNGGGAEVMVKTFNGSIYLRKAK